MDKVPAATISGQAPKPVGALCNSQLQPQQFVSLRGSGRLRPFSGSFHDLLSSCGIVSDAAFPNLFRNFPDNVSTRPTLGPRARISIHLASQSGKLSISCENRIKKRGAAGGDACEFQAPSHLGQITGSRWEARPWGVCIRESNTRKPHLESEHGDDEWAVMAAPQILPPTARARRPATRLPPRRPGTHALTRRSTSRCWRETQS